MAVKSSLASLDSLGFATFPSRERRTLRNESWSVASGSFEFQTPRYRHIQKKKYWRDINGWVTRNFGACDNLPSLFLISRSKAPPKLKQGRGISLPLDISHRRPRLNGLSLRWAVGWTLERMICGRSIGRIHGRACSRGGYLGHRMGWRMALGWPLQIQRGRQIWTIRYLQVHGRGCKEQNRESKGRNMDRSMRWISNDVAESGRIWEGRSGRWMDLRKHFRDVRLIDSTAHISWGEERKRREEIWAVGWERKLLIRPGEEEPGVGNLDRWKVRLDGADGFQRKVAVAGVGEEFEFPLTIVGNLRTLETWILEVWLDVHFKLAYEYRSNSN